MPEIGGEPVMSFENVIASIAEDGGVFSGVRREIHAHPELGFEENRTADLVARSLTSWDIPVHRGLARTGVVGVLKNGTGNRSIGLRADMDALPMTEKNSFPHASLFPGKMHACGHDGHVAMLLAAARHLSLHRNFDGTVYLVFQPAEEVGGGAREMISEGLFERFPMDAIFGVHNWPGLDAGQFAISAGPALASSNRFRIRILGKGGHAGIPQDAIDCIPIAAQLIQAFQTIVSRNVRPIDAAVLSVTMIHAGEASNVLPENCEISGTVRTLSDETLNVIEHRMRTITEATCKAYGATFEFSLDRLYPPTINHQSETDFARRVLADIVGAENVLAFEPTMAAEDFSFYLRERPGCYFFIGNNDIGNAARRMLHSPNYDFNDAVIPLGATAWVRLVENWLKRT